MSKRGKNFTELEKTLLLSIIDKYKTIIENKCTNAISVKKKQEQWDIITNKFNSASDYPRSLKQLQVAYSNLKRTTRKDVADKNKENYLKTKASTSNVIIETLDIVDIEIDTREEFNNIYLKFKKDEAEDKKAIKATGGGSYQPKLSESGARVLAIMGDQVKPLDNTCDSATDYFYNEEKSETVQKVCKAVHSNMDDFNEIIIDNGNSLDLDDTEENVHNEYAGSPPRDIEIETHKSLTAGPEHETHQSKRTRVEANDTSILKARENYYRKKLEAAVIEKRTRLIEEKIALKKLELAKLEVELKKKEIEKM